MTTTPNTPENLAVATETTAPDGVRHVFMLIVSPGREVDAVKMMVSWVADPDLCFDVYDSLRMAADLGRLQSARREMKGTQ